MGASLATVVASQLNVYLNTVVAALTIILLVCKLVRYFKGRKDE